MVFCFPYLQNALHQLLRNSRPSGSEARAACNRDMKPRIINLEAQPRYHPARSDWGIRLIIQFINSLVTERLPSPTHPSEPLPPPNQPPYENAPYHLTGLCSIKHSRACSSPSAPARHPTLFTMKHTKGIPPIRKCKRPCQLTRKEESDGSLMKQTLDVPSRWAEHAA